MSALEWLRSRPRRKATSGIVKATWKPASEDGCTLTVNNSAEGRMTRPTGIIEFAGTLTDDEVQQIRDRFLEANRPRVPKPTEGDALSCPCAVIYGRCYYNH